MWHIPQMFLKRVHIMHSDPLSLFPAQIKHLSLSGMKETKMTVTNYADHATDKPFCLMMTRMSSEENSCNSPGVDDTVWQSEIMLHTVCMRRGPR